MATNIFYFSNEADAIDFSKRFNTVEHTVNVQRVGNNYQVIVQYWSLD